ncbi:MAG: hypothetical protein M1114_05595 [Candidatus Dependentiae bacterium]|nr:hypothetical protein [Candidatus Dependentiae bacterium]
MKHLLLLACTMPLVAMENFEVNKAVIPTASKLSALSVINKNGRLDYSIADRSVQRCDIYGPLKEISSEEQLNGFLANGGKIKLSKMSNGEYALRSGVDIKGGGPVLAAITYWGVKALGYGVPAGIVIAGGAAAAPVVMGGGLAAAAGSLAGSATTLAATTGTGIVMGTTATGAAVAGATTVGTIVAGAASAAGTGVIIGNAVVAAVGVEAASLATGAVAVGTLGFTAPAAGAAVGYVAAVETAAAVAGAWAMLVPFI